MSRGIDWDAQPLGQISDCQIAKSLGVYCSSVQRQRVKRGIKPLHPRKPARLGRSERPARSDLREVVDYGASELRMTDAAMGRELGLSRERVRQLRSVDRVPRPPAKPKEPKYYRLEACPEGCGGRCRRGAKMCTKCFRKTPEHKAKERCRIRDYIRKRYSEDPAFREAQKARNQLLRSQNPERYREYSRRSRAKAKHKETSDG